jgi:hypothetical protein|tara:strand:- start:1642 stop:2052 length:411 start_codon:yes stop_codon:yes gene_type:complete
MISKAAYIARALARNQRASRAVAVRSWNQKYAKPNVQKAFDSPETAQKVKDIYNLNTKQWDVNAGFNKKTKLYLDRWIRDKTGLKGDMPYKLARFESNPSLEGLGPLARRKSSLKGQFTSEDLELLIRQLREGILH